MYWQEFQSRRNKKGIINGFLSLITVFKYKTKTKHIVLRFIWYIHTLEISLSHKQKQTNTLLSSPCMQQGLLIVLRIDSLSPSLALTSLLVRRLLSFSSSGQKQICNWWHLCQSVSQSPTLYPNRNISLSSSPICIAFSKKISTVQKETICKSVNTAGARWRHFTTLFCRLYKTLFERDSSFACYHVLIFTPWSAQLIWYRRSSRNYSITYIVYMQIHTNGLNTSFSSTVNMTASITFFACLRTLYTATYARIRFF